MAGYWPSYFFACLWTETKSRSINTQKKERGQYPAILTEQAWSIKDLLYGIKHHKMIHVLVYFQGLKRKPITCKNKWRVLYPNWVNAEIHSFDWFTILRSKCLASEWVLLPPGRSLRVDFCFLHEVTLCQLNLT